MNGLLNVNKPLGMTSHDVVNVVRRLTGVRRVGHTGTLDPLATGVLLLLVGPSTRLARFFSGADKRYRAVIRLGEETNTYDTEGTVIERRPIAVEREQVETALDDFRGEIRQIPPMYSAVKFKGQPLYVLARQGKQVERKARSVTIHALEMVAWHPPDITLDIHCSAGTYIRSLAHDLGQALGCGGHLRTLVRTAVGRFTLEESITPEDLRALAADGHLGEAIRPPSEILTLPALRLTEEQVRAVRHGQEIQIDGAFDATEIQAHDPDGDFVAILIPLSHGRWRPNLVLTTPE
ncbi:MAG: tRNA pseudouridine(55) synthase TruB [Anaerolineae bacterium]